jgi:hypothetical protein
MFASKDNVRIHYESTGSGPPVLLVMGSASLPPRGGGPSQSSPSRCA